MGSCYGQRHKRRSQKTATDSFAVYRSRGGLLMTIRGGGEPDIWNGFKAEEENGPTARSLAADANDCIMVRILLDPPNTSLRRDWLRPTAGSPLIVLGDLAPTAWRMLPCSTLSRPRPFGWPPTRPALTAPARGSVMSPVRAKKRSFGRTKKLTRTALTSNVPYKPDPGP